jgi:hypothetical protein
MMYGMNIGARSSPAYINFKGPQRPSLLRSRKLLSLLFLCTATQERTARCATIRSRMVDGIERYSAAFQVVVRRLVAEREPLDEENEDEKECYAQEENDVEAPDEAKDEAKDKAAPRKTNCSPRRISKPTAKVTTTLTTKPKPSASKQE